MKFIVNSSVLAKNLQAIGGVIPSSSSLPILENFLFELKNGILLITASDLDTTMTVSLEPSMYEDDGSVAINAKIIMEALKTLSDIPLTFNINQDNFSVDISAGEGKFGVAGYDGSDYPKPKALADPIVLHIKSQVLHTAFTKTTFAVGKDEMRPVMSGVLFDISPDRLTFVATDAHKLVRYRRTDIETTDTSTLILPTKPLNQMKSLLSQEDIDVLIEHDQKHIYFRFGNFVVHSKLIEGRFPNFEAVIPMSNPYKLVIDRTPLLNSLRRASIFANQSTHQIRVKISENVLFLSAEDIDFANKAAEPLNCNYEGDEIEIGFNAKFILEILSNVDAEMIRVELSAPNRAVLIFPTEQEDPNEEILMLVMPVMLSQ